MPVNGSVPSDVDAMLHVSELYVWHSDVVCANAELGATISASPTSNVAKRFMSPFQNDSIPAAPHASRDSTARWYRKAEFSAKKHAAICAESGGLTTTERAWEVSEGDGSGLASATGP